MKAIRDGVKKNRILKQSYDKAEILDDKLVFKL